MKKIYSYLPLSRQYVFILKMSSAFYISCLSKFQFFVGFWKRLSAYTNDRLCMNYAYIMFRLYCASDVKVNFDFEDIFSHMTAYLLLWFTSKCLPHMIVSVSSQFQ